MIDREKELLVVIADLRADIAEKEDLIESLRGRNTTEHTSIYDLGLRHGREEVKDALCELIGVSRNEKWAKLA